MKGGEETVMVVRELLEALRDAWAEGDWWGHLRAWLEVALGLVTVEDKGILL